ncbi:MAG: hypothetical protein ACREEL_09055 [Stellaceae bacterium]
MTSKEQRSKRKKTQHEKFVQLARESGADESEAAFKRKLAKIAKAQPSPKEQKK